VKRFAILFGLALVTLTLLSTSSASTQRFSYLDPSFGNHGVVRDTFGGSPYPWTLALQPDGKILVGAEWARDPQNEYQWNFLVARYLPTGKLDSTFGGKGWVTTAIEANSEARLHALGVQPDGRIVAVGTVWAETDSGLRGRLVLARYQADGSLDPSFGTDGIVMGPANIYTWASSIALQPDGKILVAAGGQDWGDAELDLLRYLPDGALDPSFGTAGVVARKVPYENAANATGVALQPDGKIVVSGYGEGNGADEIFLTRYNPDGSVDKAFGWGGYITANHYYGTGVALAADGKIFAAGTVQSWKHEVGFAVLRYTTNGQPDPTFGTDGVAREPLLDIGGSFAVQPNGRIIVAGGRGTKKTGNQVRLIRLRADGSLDPTFGHGGAISTRLSVSAWANAVALQQDGRILTVSPYGDKHGSSALARFVIRRHCFVPNVRGKRLAPAKRTIRHADCSVGKVTRVSSNRVSRGRVILQHPRRGTDLPARSKVNLVVSK
jgi:uncharacterized delta-60 repeat protein